MIGKYSVFIENFVDGANLLFIQLVEVDEVLHEGEVLVSIHAFAVAGPDIGQTVLTEFNVHLYN
jgi:hypothetical protein